MGQLIEVLVKFLLRGLMSSAASIDRSLTA